MRGFVVVEGHGEVEAAGNLVARLGAELGFLLPWVKPIRAKNLHRETGLKGAAARIRTERDVAALLILQDADEKCPKELGPRLAGWLRELDLPFPVASVLFRPEYEVLFLPCLHLMAGQPLGSGKLTRPGLVEGARWQEDWEARRGVKEWLSRHYPTGKIYKPTTDQLELTRKIDLETIRQAEVPCFGTLERAIRFLAGHLGRPGVYPETCRESSAADETP